MIHVVIVVYFCAARLSGYSGIAGTFVALLSGREPIETLLFSCGLLRAGLHMSSASVGQPTAEVATFERQKLEN